MVRFVFFLMSVILAWFILDLILRGIRFVFGGRRPDRRSPIGEEEQKPRRTDTTIYRDVHDAEFKDIPDDPKDKP